MWNIIKLHITLKPLGGPSLPSLRVIYWKVLQTYSLTCRHHISWVKIQTSNCKIQHWLFKLSGLFLLCLFGFFFTNIFLNVVLLFHAKPASSCNVLRSWQQWNFCECTYITAKKKTWLYSCSYTILVPKSINILLTTWGINSI